MSMCKFVEQRTKLQTRNCELKLPALQMFKHDELDYCQHHIKWFRTDVSRPGNPKTILVPQDEKIISL